MKENSDAQLFGVETRSDDCGPCGGAVEPTKRKYRRLRSLETNRILHVKIEKPSVQKAFDPTAWYVAEVRKRWTELKSRAFLDHKTFVNDTTGQTYQVEAYVATQTRKGVEKVFIHGKVFIRVDEANRIDVLRKCQLLKFFAKDRARALTEHAFTDFARIPNWQIERLKDIIQIADGTIEYSEEVVPQLHDAVRLNDGLLSKSDLLKDLEGTIEQVNGRKYATVVLDKLGVFKFKLPVTDLSKLL